MSKLSNTLDTIKPEVLSWIRAISGAPGSAGYAPSPHDLNSAHHTGQLNDSQAPQFLKNDGSRSLTGNLAVAAGITLDGVDLSVLNAEYQAHVLNPNAHHTAFTTLRSDTGQANPDLAYAIGIYGGNGLATSSSVNALTIHMDTPSTLGVATNNQASSGHTHALDHSNSPGSASKILSTDTYGSLLLGTDLLYADVQNRRVGINMTPSGAKLDVMGTFGEPALRVQSPNTVAPSLDLIANSLTSASLIRTTLPADRPIIEARVSGDLYPRAQLMQQGVLFGSGITTADVGMRRSGATSIVFDNWGLGGAVDVSVSRKITAGSVIPGAALINSVWAGGEQLRLGYDDLNYLSVLVDNGGSVTFQPTGDVIFNPLGNDILPAYSFKNNLGAINKKFLTIWGAELNIETLVAQDTLSTIGGRVLIAPTTIYTADVPASAGSTSLSVKHNQMQAGDVVYAEASGKIEFLQIASGPTGSGPYVYTATRDLDGTGANAWYQGDALVNTGQAGSGFIDLHSLQGVNGQLFGTIFVYDNNGAVSPYEAGSYGSNLATEPAFQLWAASPLEIGDAIYFGNTTTWNNLYMYVSTAASWSSTAYVFEYWNGSVWASFSPTITGSLTTVGGFGAEWSAGSLSGWSSKSIKSVASYWVRLRITTPGTVTTLPKQGKRRAYWRKRTFGPTIACHVRNSSTYWDFEPRSVLGNLEGYYDYSKQIFGFAAGRYGSASGTYPWISVDEDNGIRIMRGSAKLGQWDNLAQILVGQTGAGQGNVWIDSGGMRLRTALVPKIDLQTDGDVFIGSSTLNPATTFLSIFGIAQTYNGESMASGELMLGDNSSSRINLKWTAANELQLRSGTTPQIILSPAGGGTITGMTVQTSSSGTRAVMAPDGFKMYLGTNYLTIPDRAYIRTFDENNGGALFSRIFASSDLGSTTRLYKTNIETIGNDTATHLMTSITQYNNVTGRSTSMDMRTDRLTGSTDTYINLSAYVSSAVRASLYLSGGMIRFDSPSTGVQIGNPSWLPNSNALSVQGAIVAGGYIHPGNQTSQGFGFITAPYGLANAIYVSGNIVTTGYNLTHDFFRSVGTTGWYNQTYGGGIWQQVTGYIETYSCGLKINGLAGINVTPVNNHALTINGLGATSATYGLVVRDNAGNNRMFVRDDGLGNWVSTAWNVGSDRRLKNHIEDINSTLMEAAYTIPIRTYARKGSTRQEIGVIAQEVEALGLGAMVRDDLQGMKSVDYTGVMLAKIAYLERAVRRMQTQLEAA